MTNCIFILTLISSCQILHSSVWYGSKFECHGRNKCYDDQIHCDDNRHCTIECSGPNACQYTVIHCPINARCDIQCNDGIDACKDVIFLAERSTSLSITCDRSQDEACDETIIYCPNNGRLGPASCQISGINQINVKTKIEIFAIEGLNDVQITGTYINKAFLYCGPYYKYACTLIDTSPFRQCTSIDKTCENYSLPTSYPTRSPTIDPTSFPTDQPTPLPLYSKYPTIDPTNFPTDIPTPIPTPTPSRYPTNDPTSFPTDIPTPQPTSIPSTTAIPTFSEGHRTTKKPTVWAMPTMRPTRRKPDLEYPTRRPSLSPIATKRPTRYTKYGSLLTTTQQGGKGYDVGDDKEQVDPNGEKFIDRQMSDNSGNYSVLYYVIGALLVSICYISVSLFCWVHYNHKYNSRVIELKRHSRLQSPAIMPPGVVWQANHLHEPGAAVNYTRSNNNYLSAPIAKTHRDNPNNVSNSINNNNAPSVASNVTAPTTISRTHNRIGYNNNNIEEEEPHTVAPTSKSRSNSIHSHYSDDNSEFKEVDYETDGKILPNKNINMMKQASKYSIDSVEYNNTYIHDDESIVQYGEQIKDGPKETHSLKVSNISEFNILHRYNSVRNISEKNENESIKEVDIETCQKQYEQNEEHQPMIPEELQEPVQPLTNNIYNQNYGLIKSPPINESISISGSPSQMYITGNQNNSILYTPQQYGQ